MTIDHFAIKTIGTMAEGVKSQFLGFLQQPYDHNSMIYVQPHPHHTCCCILG